jgi:hypothetical protein
MTYYEYCCGPHAGRHRMALSDQRRAASTIARAQRDGRKITEAMLKALETGKRGVKFAEENITNHLAEIADRAA